jgi:hypothetical protein
MTTLPVHEDLGSIICQLPEECEWSFPTGPISGTLFGIGANLAFTRKGDGLQSKTLRVHSTASRYSRATDSSGIASRSAHLATSFHLPVS